VIPGLFPEDADLKLSEEGLGHGASIGTQIKNFTHDLNNAMKIQLYASPMINTIQTASEISKVNNISEVYVHDGLVDTCKFNNFLKESFLKIFSRVGDIP